LQANVQFSEQQLLCNYKFREKHN